MITAKYYFLNHRPNNCSGWQQQAGRQISLFACIFLLVLYGCAPASDKPPGDEYLYAVHFIDVGQGDAILVTTPDKTLLVDGGTRWAGVTNYLQAQDIEEIDIVVGTHPHADHIGGLIEVLNSFPVGEVMDPGVLHTTQTFEDYLTMIELHQIPYTLTRRGMERKLSEAATMKVLHPYAPDEEHLNNASIVVRITLGDISILLTGDIELEGESAVLAYAATLDSDILKVAHHGSRTSTTYGFLDAVKPQVSIIMCGENNRYGHPHQETLDKLHASGSNIFRTDTHGHIVIRSNGMDYDISVTRTPKKLHLADMNLPLLHIILPFLPTLITP